MKSSNPLIRFAASRGVTWLIGMVSLLVVGFEVIGPSKPIAPSAHLTLNLPAQSSLDQPRMAGVAGKRPKMPNFRAGAVGATGIRG